MNYGFSDNYSRGVLTGHNSETIEIFGFIFVYFVVSYSENLSPALIPVRSQSHNSYVRPHNFVPMAIYLTEQPVCVPACRAIPAADDPITSTKNRDQKSWTVDIQ